MICKLYQYIKNGGDMPMMNTIVGAMPGIAWKQSSASAQRHPLFPSLEHRNDMLRRNNQQYHYKSFSSLSIM